MKTKKTTKKRRKRRQNDEKRDDDATTFYKILSFFRCCPQHGRRSAFPDHPGHKRDSAFVWVQTYRIAVWDPGLIALNLAIALTDIWVRLMKDDVTQYHCWPSVRFWWQIS